MDQTGYWSHERAAIDSPQPCPAAGGGLHQRCPRTICRNEVENLLNDSFGCDSSSIQSAVWLAESLVIGQHPHLAKNLKILLLIGPSCQFATFWIWTRFRCYAICFQCSDAAIAIGWNCPLEIHRSTSWEMENLNSRRHWCVCLWDPLCCDSFFFSSIIVIAIILIGTRQFEELRISYLGAGGRRRRSLGTNWKMKNSTVIIRCHLSDAIAETPIFFLFFWSCQKKWSQINFKNQIFEFLNFFWIFQS